MGIAAKLLQQIHVYMKKQYIIQKYVMAESVKEALEKARRMPVHEVYVHNVWFDKNADNQFFFKEANPIGLEPKK